METAARRLSRAAAAPVSSDSVPKVTELGPWIEVPAPTKIRKLWDSPSTVTVPLTVPVKLMSGRKWNRPVVAQFGSGTGVPPGTWSVYVEMVGQPLIINRMSNAVTYIH